MARIYESITAEQAELIRRSPLFFVASADPSLADTEAGLGPVNLSPKGGVPLHVLDDHRVAYLDYTGSGNETARHAVAGGPVTVMVCSFEADDAAVVRLYGKAAVSTLEDSPLAALLLDSPAESIHLPQRQVIEVLVDRTITSCGYGVPVMEFARERNLSGRGRSYKEGRRAERAGG
ncbi:MAG: pyridoxamine 5'-phosphate oxidase family protein [Dehalococcoidia bacterium]